MSSICDVGASRVGINLKGANITNEFKQLAKIERPNVAIVWREFGTLNLD